MSAAKESAWRYLRRLKAERVQSAVKNSEEFRAALVRGKGVDNVHDFQSGAVGNVVIRRMDSDKFAKLKSDMAQARNDRIAFRAHNSSGQKIISLAGVRDAAYIVAGCLILMSGPILSALGLLKG